MPDADKEIHYRIAYEEAVRALSEQQAVIDSFRNRAGLLLSAAVITTSFLSARALHGGTTLHMHDSYVVNQTGLGRLAVFFQVASGLLTLEVVLWLIAIASTS